LIFGEGKAGQRAFESRVKFRKEQLSHYFRLMENLSLFEGQNKQGKFGDLKTNQIKTIDFIKINNQYNN
jgi:hypothetical protein